MELITGMFRKAGITLSRRELEQFELLYHEYTRLNDEWDLSRLTRPDDIVLKHFVDSVLPAKLIALPESLVDIGTGPGFPGIPIKIVSPATRIILAEPRFRRVEFMRMMIDKLGLENAEVYPHLVTPESWFDVDGVITRAFEAADGTLRRVNHFLPENGRVVLLKGPGADEDIAELSPEMLDYYDLVEDKAYTLPVTDHPRRILVFRKKKAYARFTYRILRDGTASLGIPVTSPDNKRLRDIRKGLEKGPKKSGITLVPGRKVIMDSIGRMQNIGALLLPDDYREADDAFNALIARLADEGKLLVIKRSLYQDIEPSGMPVLSVETPDIPAWNGSALNGCTVAIPFQDPVNTGSAIRSAAAFGVENIMMLAESANPYHPKSVRASAGSVFAVNIIAGPSMEDLPALAAENDMAIVALDARGTDIAAFDFPDRFILLPGIEGPGLPAELRRSTVSVPIAGAVESLNAYAALSIALYERARRARP